MKMNAVVGTIALSGVLVLTGCTINLGASGHGGGTDQSSRSSMMNDGDESGQLDSAEVMFAQMMIPHHEQAVEMSSLAETRASDPFIKQLAADIKAAQQPEIEQMAGWLEEWGAPRMNSTDAMSEHGQHGMAGVLTDEQMADLAGPSGLAFDRLYAEGMIEHHRGAIQMAEAVQDSSDPRVAVLADAIITAQEKEIALIEEFLAKG